MCEIIEIQYIKNILAIHLTVSIFVRFSNNNAKTKD